MDVLTTQQIGPALKNVEIKHGKVTVYRVRSRSQAEVGVIRIRRSAAAALGRPDRQRRAVGAERHRRAKGRAVGAGEHGRAPAGLHRHVHRVRRRRAGGERAGVAQRDRRAQAVAGLQAGHGLHRLQRRRRRRRRRRRKGGRRQGGRRHVLRVQAERLQVGRGERHVVQGEISELKRAGVTAWLTDSDLCEFEACLIAVP